MEVTADYATELERVKHEYEDRAMGLLAVIAANARLAGLHVPHGPFDFSDDTYRWSLTIYRTPLKRTEQDLVDVTIEIAEERDYDDPEGWGLNFGLTIGDWNGRTLASRQLYNFTPEVWAADIREPGSVEARWDQFTDFDPGQVAAKITAGRHFWGDGWYQRDDEHLAARRNEDPASAAMEDESAGLAAAGMGG